jgi:K+-sensing histidine kinase KdpD
VLELAQYPLHLVCLSLLYDQGQGPWYRLSRSILEAHGGRLSAAANAAYGTVFSFSLPVNEPTQ